MGSAGLPTLHVTRKSVEIHAKGVEIHGKASKFMRKASKFTEKRRMSCERRRNSWTSVEIHAKGVEIDGKVGGPRTQGGPRTLALGDRALGPQPSNNAKLRALGSPVSLSPTAENVR